MEPMLLVYCSSLEVESLVSGESVSFAISYVQGRLSPLLSNPSIEDSSESSEVRLSGYPASVVHCGMNGRSTITNGAC